MTFVNYNRDYDEEWQKYPVYAQSGTTEGAFKRHMPMPGPKEVFDYALMGLPKFLPLTQERITPEGFIDVDGNLSSGVNIADILTSAVVELEMEMDCNISEVVHFHTEDYIADLEQNFYGIRLQRWPAVEIVKMSLKYPHATAGDGAGTVGGGIYAEYTIPRSWITLRRNKLNVVASIGTISVETNAVTTPGGIFTYLSGFNRGNYNPSAIEIVYKAGFNSDRLPAGVSDLIKTLAAYRYLSDISAVLFPNSSVAVSIDGIAQNVSYDIQRLVDGRLEKLKEKVIELKRTFKKSFGQTVGFSFIGS